MAANTQTLTFIDATDWLDVPESVRPDRVVAFRDDGIITRIEAVRVEPGKGQLHYEVSSPKSRAGREPQVLSKSYARLSSEADDQQPAAKRT